MALISAKTIITSISLFHITLGFFFLTNPGTIADQAVVYLLGEAMGLPYARSFETQSPALAFLAVVLGIVGISDLVTFSLPNEMPEHHWGLQAPLRLFFSFLLTLYTFFFGPSSPIYDSSSRGRLNHPSAHAHPPPGYVASSWGGDALKNRVFFTFMFVETMSWFWIWVTLQEERREAAARKVRRRSSHSHTL
ncbi:increased loss of mitochondrial DNA protein 1 [Cercophora newfieldiana]|uniref:Increased loss of mitochondrial DNA protein 1 n=1 Tax=Cercophora newfieldiana TaxID=92897 RepID=A0AA39YCB3_9PEZI|nr:increased loss of mitochondrial DNA protein 1 [Cercophora newfieldiana]